MGVDGDADCAALVEIKIKTFARSPKSFQSQSHAHTNTMKVENLSAHQKRAEKHENIIEN